MLHNKCCIWILVLHFYTNFTKIKKEVKKEWALIGDRELDSFVNCQKELPALWYQYLLTRMSIMTDVWWEQVLNPVQNFQPNFKEIWGERTHWLFSSLGVKAIPIFSQFASFWLRGSTNDVYWFLEIYQCTSFLLSGQPKKGSKIWGPIHHHPLKLAILRMCIKTDIWFRKNACVWKYTLLP